MPTRSGCSLSTDIDTHVSSNMAGKSEGKGEGPPLEKEPTRMDLYNLMLDMKNELKKDIKDSADGFQKEIDGIKKRVKVSESKIEINKISLEQELEEVKSKATPLDEYTATITQLERRIEQLESNAAYQDHLIKSQAEKISSFDDDKRKYNMIFYGMKEQSTLPLRQQVNELFSDLGVTFTEAECDYIYRIGPVPQNKARPRPALVQLSKLRFKGEIFKNVHKLKDNDKWSRVHIAEDMSEVNSRKQRDLRAIMALAIDKGYEARVNGLNIIIDGKRFSYNNIDQLPSDLSLSAAKTIEVKDGYAFQGPHSPLSAMHKCSIKDGSNDYKSLEQGYFHKAAIHHQLPDLAKTIMQTNEAFELHNLGKKIKHDKIWNDNKLTKLDELNFLKFSQNPKLGQFLKDTGKGILFEATKDPFYGCGHTLAQRKVINVHSPGQNESGKSVMRTRDQLFPDQPTA